MPDDVPVRLRPRAVVPAGWPADVAPNQIITAAHINAIRSSVYAWPGDVDGQGHTLSNVNIAGATGVMLDPTTTAGDLIARGAAALERLPVGGNGQVLAVDTALPGKLRWATPAAAPVASVFGRVGAVVAQAGDYTAAQVTGALADSLTTKGDIFARGAAATGRFPAGADGQVLRADASQAFGLRWSGESVPSVFGRTGPIAAQAGDYTAADVTNAVSVLGTYPDPAWIPSLAWTKLIGAPATFPAAPHTHDAAAIVAGVLATARLGTGVADATVYLRGDGTWAAAGSGGGGGVISVFGRAGNVIAQSGDYTAAMVTGAVANPTSIKGDLMVRNDLNSIVRLPVGASGQVLQADTSLTTGMKWTTLGAAVQTPWVTDVDAANFQLVNVRRLGVAIALPAYPLDVVGDVRFTGTLRQNGELAVSGGDIDLAEQVANRAIGFYVNGVGGRFTDTLGVSNSRYGITYHGGVPGYSIGLSGWGGLRFYTQDLERVTIAASGSVGIGLSSPSSLLDVAGDIRSRNDLVFTKGATPMIYVSDNFDLRIGTNSAERMRIMAGGAVCMGLQAPTSFTHTLTVYHAGLRNICAVSDGTEAGIMVSNTASGGHNFSLYSSGGASGLGAGTFSIFDDTVSTPRLMITANGRVAIGGQFVPAYALDVSGDVNCSGTFRVNGVPKMAVTADAVDDLPPNGGLNLWLDEAANRLAVRYRNAAGVLKTGYLPME